MVGIGLAALQLMCGRLKSPQMTIGIDVLIAAKELLNCDIVELGGL